MAHEIKTLADAIGLPDHIDKARIKRFFARYEKQHPGELGFHRDTARDRLKDPKFATSETGAHRYLFEFPEPIGIWLGQAYPLMFKDRKHTAWFVKHFPEYLIPEKY